MNINKRVEQIMSEFNGYTGGCRLLMLMHRKKDGADRSTIMQRRVITNNSAEFEVELTKMVYEAAYSLEELRVYSSVNERDPEKAIREFKRRQLDMDYVKPEERMGFYMDIKNQWISCLMKPSNRIDTTFLVDVDEDDDLELTERILAGVTRNFTKYKTKNGWHFLIQPFNPKIDPGLKIKKDGLILLYYTKFNK